MSRIRSIKPEFWRDQDLSIVSAEAALLAIGLLNHSDDEGYFNANPRLIHADVFPLRELSLSIPELLSELSRIGYVRIFTGSDGREYGVVTNFSKHQKISRPTPSKIRDLEQITEDSVSAHEQFTEDSVNGQGGLTIGKEQGTGKGTGKGKEQGDNALARGTPMSDDFALPDEWLEKAKAKGMSVETAVHEFERFRNHHIGKGTRSKDWARQWATWYLAWVSYGAKQVGAEKGRKTVTEDYFAGAI